MKISIKTHSIQSTTNNCNVLVYMDSPKLDHQIEIGLVLDENWVLPEKQCGILSDLLLISAATYSIDKFFARADAEDAWTRQFSVDVEVSNQQIWQTHSSVLENMLGFLTGDIWRFSFSQGGLFQSRFKSNGTVPLTLFDCKVPKAVCLFSGGLDSLIGAINWLETHDNDHLILAGHYDQNIGGPKSQQLRLFDGLCEQYGDRVDLHQIMVSPIRVNANESTYRSRSFLFLSAGTLIAASYDKSLPLLIPENQTIAVNAPLTPSRRGSCSTRTAHPRFLSLFQELLNKLSIDCSVINSLSMRTKGECVSQCLNSELLNSVVDMSVSCAKGGHTSSWIRKSANHCGICMPCIYRRAALHMSERDTQEYGRDICAGELPFDCDGANDFRAYVAFMERYPSREHIIHLLIGVGSLPADKIPEYADCVYRAMQEIKKWLSDKAVSKVKEYAGI